METNAAAGIIIINNGTLNIGELGYGIYGQGTNNVFTNNNLIALDDLGYGMYTNGAGAQVTNTGSITGSNGGNYGFYIHGANSSAVNSATITLNGGISDVGVYSNATGNSLLNSGNITIGSTSSYGMHAAATGNTLTNSGEIIINGTSSAALENTANGNTLINNGTIHINTGGSNAFDANSANDIFINNGSIIGTGDTIYGFYEGGNNGSMTNRGSITLTGDSDYGMLPNGTGGSAVNYGTISVLGDNGAAMRGNNSNNTLINYGTLTASGFNADGLQSDAVNNTLTNYGRIAVAGTDSDAMSGPDNNIITNYGTLSTNGNGYGVYAFGDNIAVNNYGRITSVGNHAVLFTGNNGALLMGANAVIDGTVNYGGTGGTLEYNLSQSGRGGSVSAITGAITGAHTTSITGTGNLSSGARVIQGGNVVAVVTPDNFASANQVVSQTLGYTGDVVNNRQQMALLGETREVATGTQYAANTSSMNDASSPSSWAMRDRKIVWAEAFGSYQERPDNGTSAYSKATSGGGLAGVDMPQTDDGIRSGVYVGGFSGNLDIGKNNFRNIDSSGALAGGYIGKSYGAYYVSGQLAAGYTFNDSTRFTGVDTATSDYNSFFISPSVTVMRPVTASGATWIPSATLRYTAQFDESYNETGSIANQNVDSHITNAIEARAMLEARLNAQQIRSGIFQPALRAGVKGQTTIGNNNVDMQILGTNISFDPSGSNDYVDGIIGATMTYSLTGGPQFYLDGEANLGLNKGGMGDNKGITGRIGAKWKM